jgi:hypothetical protein
MEMSGVDAPAERLIIYEHVCTASSRAYTWPWVRNPSKEPYYGLHSRGSLARRGCSAVVYGPVPNSEWQRCEVSAYLRRSFRDLWVALPTLLVSIAVSRVYGHSSAPGSLDTSRGGSMKDIFREPVRAARSSLAGIQPSGLLLQYDMVQQVVCGFDLWFIMPEAELVKTSRIYPLPQGDVKLHEPGVQSNLDIAAHKPTSRHQPSDVVAFKRLVPTSRVNHLLIC